MRTSLRLCDEYASISRIRDDTFDRINKRLKQLFPVHTVREEDPLVFGDTDAAWIRNGIFRMRRPQQWSGHARSRDAHSDHCILRPRDIRSPLR